MAYRLSDVLWKVRDVEVRGRVVSLSLEARVEALLQVGVSMINLIAMGGQGRQEKTRTRANPTSYPRR